MSLTNHAERSSLPYLVQRTLKPITTNPRAQNQRGIKKVV